MKRGFTLIEIMVVVIIIGLLLTVGIPLVAKSKDQGTLDRAVTDIALLNNALEQYKSTYPGTDPSTVMSSSDAAFTAVSAFMKVESGVNTMTKYNATTSSVYAYAYSSTTGQFEATANDAATDADVTTKAAAGVNYNKDGFPINIPATNGAKLKIGR